MNTSEVAYKIDDFINYFYKKDNIEARVVIEIKESGFVSCSDGTLNCIKRDKDNKDSIYISFGETHLWVNIEDIIGIEECGKSRWCIDINTECVERLELRKI